MICWGDEAIPNFEIAPQGLSRSYGKKSINGIASTSLGLLSRNDDVLQGSRSLEVKSEKIGLRPKSDKSKQEEAKK